MKRRIYACLILVSVGVALSTPVSAQNADKIVAKYLKAIGGYKKLKAIQTLRLKGAYKEGNFAANTTILWKRPSLRLVIVGDRGAAYLEGYNGTSWEYLEESKKLKLTAGTAGEAAARRGAEFDESFVDAKTKGHTVELMGREVILGKDTFHLRVKLKDGWTKSYYLDAKTYLIVALRKAMPLHATGPDIESLSTYEDYRTVAGVLFPHRFVERKVTTGEIMNTLKWDQIEANIEIGSKEFDPPATSIDRIFRIPL